MNFSTDSEKGDPVRPVGIKCEKSRHQRKDAKRCEKSGKDAKRAVLWKKNRLCYLELDFDRTDVIKNKCQ